MFEKFTQRARRVVVLAQQESRMLGHDYIGTEHLLLGLIREGEGVAAKALESLDISLEAVRQQVEGIIGRGEATPAGQIPFTPRAKKVLELSLREAKQLRHDYIGTEHILLGLIREGEGVAAQVLIKMGGELPNARDEVIRLLAGGTPPTATSGPQCPNCRVFLEGELRYRPLDAQGDEGSGVRSAVIVFCGRCGYSLGALPPEGGA